MGVGEAVVVAGSVNLGFGTWDLLLRVHGRLLFDSGRFPGIETLTPAKPTPAVAAAPKYPSLGHAQHPTSQKNQLLKKAAPQNFSSSLPFLFSPSPPRPTNRYSKPTHGESLALSPSFGRKSPDAHLLLAHPKRSWPRKRAAIEAQRLISAAPAPSLPFPDRPVHHLTPTHVSRRRSWQQPSRFPLGGRRPFGRRYESALCAVGGRDCAAASCRCLAIVGGGLPRVGVWLWGRHGRLERFRHDVTEMRLLVPSGDRGSELLDGAHSWCEGGFKTPFGFFFLLGPGCWLAAGQTKTLSFAGGSPCPACRRPGWGLGERSDSLRDDNPIIESSSEVEPA